MKYLKNYKIFESKGILDEVKFNIEDIFLDASDKFNFSIQPYISEGSRFDGYKKVLNFKIGIYPGYKRQSTQDNQIWIDFNDIKDEIDRMFDYLETVGEVKVLELNFNPVDEARGRELVTVCSSIKWDWEKAKKYFSKEGIEIEHKYLNHPVKLDDNVKFLRIFLDVWVYLD